MTCREHLAKRGITILATHPEGCEFICTWNLGPTLLACELEEVDFWDYTSPLSEHTLREPWWPANIDSNDEKIFLVMGNPDQEV